MKKLLLFTFIATSFIGNCQAFLKPIPKVVVAQKETFGFRALALASASDSFINVIRPVASLLAYSQPGNILSAGAGVSYQHDVWDATANKWNCEWSVSAMMWAGGSIAPSTPSQAISYGIMFGVLNNLIQIGPALNGKKVVAMLSIGISLNN